MLCIVRVILAWVQDQSICGMMFDLMFLGRLVRVRLSVCDRIVRLLPLCVDGMILCYCAAAAKKMILSVRIRSKMSAFHSSYVSKKPLGMT